MGQQAQGETLGRDGQVVWTAQALTGGMPERPQALGGPQVGPVGFGRLLHGQHAGATWCEATGREPQYGFGQYQRGAMSSWSKQAIGRFAHRAAATASGRSGSVTGSGRGRGPVGPSAGSVADRRGQRRRYFR